MGRTAYLAESMKADHYLRVFASPNLLSQYVLDDPKVLSLLRNSAMLLILAPLLVVYSFAQRYFIQSIERSGLVG